MNGQQAAPRASTQRPPWLQAGAAAVGFATCAALAWFAVQALELPAVGEEADLRSALAYLARNALGYSALASLPLLALHAVRLGLQRATRHADTYTVLLLGAVLALPTWQQAFLLTTGNQIIESRAAVPLRIGLLLGLLGANLTLWRIHLELCCAKGLHMPRLWQRVPRVVRSAAEAVVSIAALVILLWQINYGLRQYNFLARFLLPSTWLVAGSLFYAALCRLPPLARGLCVAASAAALALLCPGGAHAVKRAQTVFVRTGAVAGLTDLAIGTHHPPAFANIDVSHPESFDCAAQPPVRSTTLRYDTPAAQRRNVILISVDALRKDTVDALRDGRPAMPELLAFAKQSLVFERAVTSYPATLFALGSALTGQSPSEVLFAPKVPDNLFTLSRQRFSQQLVSLPQSRWFTKSIVSRLFTQGAQTLLGPDAREQTRSLIARLEQARKSGASVLGWIHYYETHESLDRAAHSNVDPVPVYLRDASEIDAQIGRLVKYLRDSGYLNDSLVLVFADHGEALGERRHFGHHVYLNRWIIDVPMLLHAPSVAPGKSDALVTIADIAPTVLHWAGLPVPASEARSLLPAAEPSHAVAERFAISEAFPVRGAALFDLARTPIGSVQALLDRVGLVQQSAEEYLPKVSVVSSRYRLIVNRVTGAEELYDRDHDPAESHDLADDGRPVQARMRAALAQWTKTLSARIYCRVARVAQH